MDLTRRGVVITAKGGRLIVDGPNGALTEDVIARLGRLKSELLGLLAGRSASSPWDAEDWVAYFDERVAIRERDGELDPENAVRLAMEDTVTHWMSFPPCLTQRCTARVYSLRSARDAV